jgi:hypothetical protein
MRTIPRLLHGAMLAMLILSVAAVTASGAVRGHGNGNGGGSGNAGGTSNGNGNASGKDKPKDGGANGNGQAPTAPATPTPTPATPPAPPGQAKKNGTSSPATPPPGHAKPAPTPHGSATPSANASVPTDASAPIPPAAPAPPELGRSMAVTPVAGAVHVRLPGSSGYVSLADAGSIPTGSVVDARSGTLTLRSALDRDGGVQTATVRGAVFEVRQSSAGNGITDLVLRGGRPEECGNGAGGARIASVGVKKRSKQGTLWVRDRNGRFRTRGRNSVATVRGTRWSTRETCTGTVTRVMQGAVDVRDLRTGRTVTVHRGHAYLARTSG